MKAEKVPFFVATWPSAVSQVEFWRRFWKVILSFPGRSPLFQLQSTSKFTRIYGTGLWVSSKSNALNEEGSKRWMISRLFQMLPGGFLGSIVVSIPACHPGDRGSIPRRGECLFYFLQYSAWLKSQTEIRYFQCSVCNVTPADGDNSNVFGNI